MRPSLVEHSRAINLIYQFWIHTDTIRSIGKAEAVLNTPSHHRVHHGSNQRYLDRNHAGILIVWDRMFGTFQPELPDEDPVVYGLTKNVGSHNWWTVATHEYRQMFRDIADSHTWRDPAVVRAARSRLGLRPPRRHGRTCGHDRHAPLRS